MSNEKSNRIETAEAKPGCAPATGSASRLWRVTVEYELLVVADNEREAESEGEYYAGADGSDRLWSWPAKSKAWSKSRPNGVKQSRSVATATTNEPEWSE